MDEKLLLGFRVEIAKRFVPSTDIVKAYNIQHTQTNILGIHYNGKITVEKVNSVVVAKGEKNKKGKTGLVNFAVMSPLESQQEVIRIVQIINVLGNDKLIKERVSTFVSGKSLLNSIPELSPIKSAFKDMEEIIPGFVKAGWYYAPEAILGT